MFWMSVLEMPIRFPLYPLPAHAVEHADHDFDPRIIAKLLRYTVPIVYDEPVRDKSDTARVS